MKYLIYILVLISLSLNGQDIVRSGYFNAHRGDSIGYNRTTLAKAQADCEGMAKTNWAHEDIWVSPVTKWVYNAPYPQPVNIQGMTRVSKVWVSEITQTSVNIFIEVDNLFKELYVQFRTTNNEWESGGEWIETSKGIDMILHKDLLISNTIYEYQIIVDNEIGHILIFKTL